MLSRAESQPMRVVHRSTAARPLGAYAIDLVLLKFKRYVTPVLFVMRKGLLSNKQIGVHFTEEACYVYLYFLFT